MPLKYVGGGGIFPRIFCGWINEILVHSYQLSDLYCALYSGGPWFKPWPWHLLSFTELSYFISVTQGWVWNSAL